MSTLSSTKLTSSIIVPLFQHYGPPRFTIRQLNQLLVSNQITCVDICYYAHHLAIAGEQIWDLNAFERLVPIETIHEQAQMADEQRQQQQQQREQQLRTSSTLNHQNGGEVRTTTVDNNYLLGLPVTIKANLAVATQPLTAGSYILGASRTSLTSSLSKLSSNPNNNIRFSDDDIDDKNLDVTQRHIHHSPVIGYDAEITKFLLQKSGGVLIGQTSMDEFGMGSLGYNIVTNQPGRNPLPYLTKNQQPYQNQQKQSSWNTEQQFDDQMASSIIKLPLDVIMETHEKIWERINERFDIKNEQKQQNQDQHQHHDSSSDSDSYYYYSAGGSSCGSAISISHGSSVVSLGSDTGGSIRLPAAWCGVIGLKPTYGRFSRDGLVAYASSLDCVGIISPSVDCAQITFQTLLRHQSETTIIKDSTLNRQYTAADLSIDNNNNNEDDNTTTTTITNDEKMNLPLSGFTIGIPTAFVVSECSDVIQKAWLASAKILEENGATIKHIPITELSPRIVQQSLAAYYVISCAEASSNLARYDGFRYGVGSNRNDIEIMLEQLLLNDTDTTTTTTSTTVDPNFVQTLVEQQYSNTRTNGFGFEVIRRILCGTAVLSSNKFHTYYEAAMKLRATLTKQMHHLLTVSDFKQGSGGTYDCLLVPTVLFPPPKRKRIHCSDRIVHEENGKLSATEAYSNDIMTVPISLSGLPAISVPLFLQQQQQQPIFIDDKNKKIGDNNNNNNNNILGDNDNDWPEFLSPSLQIVSARNQEMKMLKIASVLENAVANHIR